MRVLTIVALRGQAPAGPVCQTRSVRRRAIAAPALALALLAACSDDLPAPRAVPTPTPTAVAIAANTDVPAQQVLALVPEQATILTVTEFARIRDQRGYAGDDGIWELADRSAPMLTRGMFRDGGAGGIRQTDILWEAHFTGGAEGYVVRFADDTDLSGLQPPAGATVRAAAHELVSGVATDPGVSWASAPELAGLVPDDAEATYVQRGCTGVDETDHELEPLEAYSVQLGSTVATARLGPGRRDLFLRMRLGEGATPFNQGFDQGFVDGSADPSSGRIGYRLVDPVKAADLTLRQRLPFAVCAS